MNADWKDEEEDLIQTDAQDILWSSDIGSAFEEYGQKLIKILGDISNKPRKENAWQRFVEFTKFEEQVENSFPTPTKKKLGKTPLNRQKRCFPLPAEWPKNG